MVRLKPWEAAGLQQTQARQKPFNCGAPCLILLRLLHPLPTYVPAPHPPLPAPFSLSQTFPLPHAESGKPQERMTPVRMQRLLF